MGDEKARVEKKISRYTGSLLASGQAGQQQLQPSSVASQYTSEKISNLRRFLENVHSESGFSESESMDDSMQSVTYSHNQPSRGNGSKQPLERQSQQHLMHQMPSSSQRIPIKQTDIHIQPATSSSTSQPSTAQAHIRGGASLQELEMHKQEIITLQEEKQSLESEVSSVSRQLKEANVLIDELRDSLERESRRTSEAESQTKQEFDRRSEETKQQFEATIERNLKFINQIIQDKNELNTQVESLGDRLRVSEERYSTSVKENKEKFMKELKANKEAWMAAEKSRKEKWMSEKQQEMKDNAIKGLEPEIERIIGKSKLEIKKIEEKHAKVLSELREKLREESDEKMRAFREKTLLEADEMITTERAFKAEKAKEQLSRLESAHTEERDRMKRSYEDRLREVDERRREESESALRKFRESEERHIEEVRTLKTSYNSSMEAQRFDARQSLQQQKEQLRIEQEKWMELQTEKAKDELARRTIEMRKRMEKERDAQIEVIVAKIADETLAQENKIASKVQPQIAAVHADYKEQIQELQRQLAYYQDQASNESKKKNEIHEQVQVIEKKWKEETKAHWESEKQKGELKKVIEDLENRIRRIENETKKEIEDVRVLMQGEIDRLKKEVLLLNKSLEAMDDDRIQELEAAEEKHATALTELEDRVRVILQKKDHQITRLKEDIKYRDATCERLQQLLDKQRNDLVKQITEGR